MASSKRRTTDPGVTETVTISTGQTVELPVRLRATVLGATFAASRAKVAALLPDGLEPIRATPTGDAAVTLASIEYHEVDIPGLEPYNEFAVIVPASHAAPSSVPYLSAMTQATNGYVWFLPVTTDAATAFGIEVWGYPKVVADITHDDGAGRETTVTVDGERFVTFAIDPPPSMNVQDEGFSYAVMDDQLRRVTVDIDAAAGLWPFSASVSVSFGDHPRAERLRALDLGPRALGRISLDGDLTFHPGEPV